MQIFQKIYGNSTRGKLVRASALTFCLYLDLLSPGYMHFANPLRPFIVSLPVQNLLNCPSRALVSIPPIPFLARELGSKQATEQDLTRKLGLPVCRRDGIAYWKLSALGKSYYLAANISSDGKVIGYQFFGD